jgi:L-serine dehydratase
MKYISLFDIVGPIMVGPSSSHTAGAVRLGFLAGKIYGLKPKKVKFTLYNSFAKTGKGHGTDKGLLGGILGLYVDDIKIRDAYNFADEQNIEYQFQTREDPVRYPNSVDIEFLEPETMKISGDSVGAGEILIKAINGFNVDMNGDYPTILLIYKDKPGMLSKVSAIIQESNVNIASLNCERNAKGKEASMSICLDSVIREHVVEEITQIPDVYWVRSIDRLRK